MKFMVSILLTATLAFISGLYLPWWGIAGAALLVAVMVHQKSWKAFLSGFLGIFLLWAGLAWWIDMKNNGVLSQKIASILPLGGNTILLIGITAFVGGIVGGFSALSGSFLRAGSR